MSCPPCTHDCDQGDKCTASLATGNGGNVITNGVPLPPRPKTFTPDYGIEYTQVSHHSTLLGWVVAMVFIVAFVITAYRQF